MANVTAVAAQDIIYNTPHGRIIVLRGDSYTIDTALAAGKQFISTVKVAPVATTITTS
jgi:hypothetical protein